MSNQLTKREHFPALDGLRGVACIMVVTYHLFPFFHKYLFFGWMSMDIFFVLSGFLITDILMKTFGEKNYLKNFYARRLLRVFPLYYAALIFFLLILPQLGRLQVSMDYFLSNQIYFWVFLQNWLLIFKPPEGALLNHLWSMAVEEQFYLLWPLAVALIRKPRTLLALLVLLLVAFSTLRFVLWMKQIEQLSYFSFFTFTRFDGILIGCMVALLQKINPKFIGKNIALIVFSFAAFNFLFYFLNLRYKGTLPYLGLLGFSTFSMLFGLLVYDIINRQSRMVTAILDLGPLNFMGRVSYGTYIFHWPLYLLLEPSLSSWIGANISPVAPHVLTSVIIAILSVIVGYLSFRYFESYFLRMKKHFAS